VRRSERYEVSRPVVEDESQSKPVHARYIGPDRLGTRPSAYAEFVEKDKGRLEPGKRADLAVLSQDIFKVDASALPKAESVLMLVDGKIVYDGKVIPLIVSRTKREHQRVTR
jgi:hypothetical protein